MQGFWGRRSTFPFPELGLSEIMCRPELSVVCGGWWVERNLSPERPVRPEALCKGMLSRDSQALSTGSRITGYFLDLFVSSESHIYASVFTICKMGHVTTNLLLSWVPQFYLSVSYLFKEYLSSIYYITGPRSCVWDVPVINTDMFSALVALLSPQYLEVHTINQIIVCI